MISGVSHRSRIASPALPLVWWARLAHSLTPVRPGPRRGRRLAILAAADATRLAPPAASAAVQSARASLTAAHDDDPNRPGRTLAADRRASALQACLPLLAKRAAEASDYLRALEADAPQVAVEGPSLVLQLTLAGALVAEGWLTHASLGATTLAESPVVLLASSIMAAPLAATLLSMAGASIRRMVWLGRPAWSECALVGDASALEDADMPLDLTRTLDVPELTAVGLSLTLADLTRHVFVTGASGSGKTSSIAVPLIRAVLRLRETLPASQRPALIVIDPKKELGGTLHALVPRDELLQIGRPDDRPIDLYASIPRRPHDIRTRRASRTTEHRPEQGAQP